MEPLEYINTEEGKDRVARKHIRAIEERLNEFAGILGHFTIKEDQWFFNEKVVPVMTEGLGEMKRFTVGSSAKRSTANVMPPTDIPPTGTVKEKSPRSEENVLVRDASEQGWASVKRDFVNEFCENLGVTPVWPTES